MLPGIRNAGANAVFAGDRANATMGYGAFNGTRQQLATINADNNITDFDEPAAESAIGWKGVTLAPRWSSGNLDLSGEVTFLDCGMDGELTVSQRIHLVWMLWAFTRGDIPAMGEQLRSLSVPFRPVDEERFRKAWERLH